MWLAFILFAAALFAAAALISPIGWFFIPAVALLGLALAMIAGLVGVGQEKPSGPQLETEPHDEGPNRVTGYAHSGQAPGHSS